MFYLIFDLLEKGRKPGIGKQAPEKLWSRAYSLFSFLVLFFFSFFLVVNNGQSVLMCGEVCLF